MPEEDYPRYLYSYDSQRRRRKKRKVFFRRFMALALFCCFVVATVLVVRAIAFPHVPGADSGEPTTTTEPMLNMTVAPIASTTPAAFNFTTEVFRGITKLPTYKRDPGISFGSGKNYTDLEGIITFRGNNYREGSSYGTAVVDTAELEITWQVTTGSVERSETAGPGIWEGSGWTGQPLVVKWPEDVKQKMNIDVVKKAAPDLVEVIYPCLDGKIYFLDLKDGSRTRRVIDTKGGAIKGTASIYPDGTPLLFVGQGDALPASQPRRSGEVPHLQPGDQKLLHTFGTDDPVAYRKAWQAYDCQRPHRRRDRHPHRTRRERASLYGQAEHQVGQGGRHAVDRPGRACEDALHHAGVR